MMPRTPAAKTAVLVAIVGLFGLLASCTPAEYALFQASYRPPANPVHLNRTLLCIRHHESDRGAYPYDRGYGAQNPRSTASGAYQFLDGTWRSRSAAAGHGGIARAKYASVEVQDAVAYYTITHGGTGPWRGSGC